MVSFKSEAVQQRIEKRRKAQSSSFGVIIAFLVLAVVAGIFGVMKFWNSTLTDEIEGYKGQIADIKGSMKSSMNGDEADLYKRMEYVQRNIYKKHSSVTILNEIEDIIVPRVVLLSFQHSVDKLGLEQITITADADEFYLMAQQVEEFKNSTFFSNVRVGDTSKNNVGRIVFTITADVADSDYSMYSQDNKGMIQQNVQENVPVETVPEVQIPVTENQETTENVGENTEGTEAATEQVEQTEETTEATTETSAEGTETEETTTTEVTTEGTTETPADEVPVQ